MEAIKAFLGYDVKYQPDANYEEEVSKNAIELINKFKLSHNLQIPDAIIGATCVVYDIELFTYNTKDFKFIPGIKLYDF